MEIIRGLHSLQKHHKGNVVTVGNFDGVHLGHQEIIKQLKKHASKFGVPLTVITFHPNPQEFFAPETAPAKLTRFHDKMRLLEEYGVDRVLNIPFSASLAQLEADDFIKNILVDGLDTKHLVIGDDFRFGKNRKGDFKLLQNAGESYEFSIEATPTYCVENERVSSTRIRQAMARGDLSLAEKLLGRTFNISGHVAHGDKRGRIIGFPTANIRLKQQIAPTNGVYAVKITGLDNEYSGVANIGVRPTVDGSQYLLEVHLFNFDQTIYNKRINVHFEEFIRTEQKFDDLDTLVEQIKQDSTTAKELLRIN